MADNNTYTPYTLADIERYLQGKMSTREMHDIEKAALQDPFLSDSIEGYKQAPLAAARQHLNEITAALNAPGSPARIIAMPPRRTRLWVQVSVAASLLLVASAVWVLVNKNSNLVNKQVANNIPVSPNNTHVADSSANQPKPQDMARTNDVVAAKKPVTNNRKAKENGADEVKEKLNV
ncbi:MAG TPA: hypothetical protein VHB48_08540, partial [Chitinophagaceae bacterium]|nr:hypothetical protein [Chitinophagaceae bacterium]